MLTVDELWALMARAVSRLPSVEVSLEGALGRTLDEEILADSDVPAFDRSAMDGYLLSEGAPAGRYRIIGEIQPGVSALPVPGPGEALRIFTGSAVCGGGIVMLEDTQVEDSVVVTTVSASDRYVRRRASQARQGEVLLSPGTVLTPGALALAAALGKSHMKASPEVRVVHVVTGSEIVPVSETPGPGSVRDSNSILIEALLARAGARRVGHHHISEDVADGMKALGSADAEIFLISGGASVGQYDGTSEILTRSGFSIHSDKVKSRPGKPLIFATRGRQVAFGLPGNPLSHFVCFHLFVARAIKLLSGLVPPGLTTVSVDGDPLPLDSRETWWPARVYVRQARLYARPLAWRDSSDVTGLPHANALLRISSQKGNGLVEALVFDNVAHE